MASSASGTDTVRLRTGAHEPRNPSIDLYRYSNTPDDLHLPESQINDETVQLLQEFVLPRQDGADLEPDPHLEEDVFNFQRTAEEWRTRPWYRRPSPWWFLISAAVSSFVISAAIAPRLELYTLLVCDYYKPVESIEGNSIYAWAGNSERRKQCAADPVVNASVGKLVMVYALCMGVLGCISTGWWTSRSDRVGRVPVLGLGLFGLLFADANFIFVAKFSKSLPGNYWWFVLGALVEGIFGSISTLNATIHAYVADTVEPHSRVHIFSLFYGLIFCGSALGPTVGGLIVRFTGTPLSVFYMGLCIHTVYASLGWFVVPESLTAAQQRESRRQYDQNILRIQQEATDAPILARFKRLFGFLSPLSVVWETTGRRRSLKAGARGDWSLILMVTSLGVAALLKGSYSYKFQYALAVFGWSSEQLGYLLSVVGFTRAAFLTFILPVIIKLIKPKPPPAPAVQLPETPNEAFGQETETAPLRRNAHAPQSTTQSIVFDLNLMRVSVLIEVVTFLAMPFAGSSLMFSALTVINCFGIGRAPTSQSVSLALYAQRGGTESGKLLGALGVLQIISSQILGPALFGTTFVKTIATNPAAIFFVSALLVGISLTLLLCIRVPETVQDVEEPLDAEESSALHR